jgi:predicted MPP superfamily phosphohydrolase
VSGGAWVSCNSIYVFDLWNYDWEIQLQSNKATHFFRFYHAFDGFTITQISDVHSGSFDNPEKISYAILVNEQNSDMILFTGDIVNTTDAKEMHPWIETFNKIKKHSMGSILFLGNHDYGEYVTPTEVVTKENFQAIKNLYGEIDLSYY